MSNEVQHVMSTMGSKQFSFVYTLTKLQFLKVADDQRL
jgi:hypothetical protein